MNTKLTPQEFLAFLQKMGDILGPALNIHVIRCTMGLLFLKRISDVFEEKHEHIVQCLIESGQSKVDAVKTASDVTFYSDTFFIPEMARWSYLK